MADTSLVYNIVARDQASSTFSKISGKAAVLGAAIGAMAVKFGKDSVTAFVDAEQSQIRLQAAFDKFPKLADTNINRLNNLNASLAKKTKFDDDATASGQAVLAQFQLTGSQIERLTPLLQDYAAKTGKDLPTAAGDFGKAMLGQGRALKAIGVDFKDTGSASGNFSELMGGLRTQVGGFAETEGKSAAGQAAILKNQFGEVEETVGSKLVPVLTTLAGVLLKVVGFVQDNSRWLGPLVGTLGAFATAVWAVNAASKAYTATQTALNFVLSANPIGLVVIAIAALTAGIILAYKHSETFRTIVNGAFHVVGDAAGWLWGTAIKPAFDSIKGAFTAIGSVFQTMWTAVLKPAFSTLVSVFLGVAGSIVDGAATAFGWIPGIGGKLKDARDHFETFKSGVNAQLNGINDETVKVTYEAVTVGFGRYAGKPLPAQKSATGGAIHGPGTGTSDSIPALLSNGEHVITAREVQAAGGHGAIQSFRKGLLRRANGGAVTIGVQNRETGLDAAEALILAAGQGLASSMGGPLRRALDWAGSQVGKPYIWGGVGPAGYDCSGFMSAIANVALGQSPYSRRFATDSMVGGGVGGFSRGAGGFSIGVMHGNPGHTAGTIMGVNVESRGGEGVVVGPRARGATNGLFSSLYHLSGYAGGGAVGDLPYDSVRKRKIGDLLQELGISYDDGGYLPVGTSLVHNGTGRPEPVGAGNTYNITVQTLDAKAAGPLVIETIQEYERRNGNRWRS